MNYCILRKWFFAIMTSVALLFFACDEDSGDSSPPPEPARPILKVVNNTNWDITFCLFTEVTEWIEISGGHHVGNGIAYGGFNEVSAGATRTWEVHDPDTYYFEAFVYISGSGERYWGMWLELRYDDIRQVTINP